MEGIVGQSSMSNLLKEKWKNIRIETYMENPFMLLLRTEEKNIVVDTKRERLNLMRKDRLKTRIISIPINQITEHSINEYDTGKYDLMFAVGEIKYKLFLST